MKCKISRNAAKVLRAELDKPENEGKKLRVYVTHSHGDHAHYGISMDEQNENDELVATDKEIDVLLTKGDAMLDGVRIDYFYVPEEGFVVTNPTMGNHGDH